MTVEPIENPPWLSMLTCPDRREYVEATMASLKHAGIDSFKGKKKLFVDGPTDGYAYPGWDVETLSRPEAPDKRLGTKEALLTIMRRTAQAGAPYLIYTEDDILYSKNAVPAIQRIEVPDDLAFLVFCDIKDVGKKPGITETPGYDFEGVQGEGGHWGNQLMKLPLRSLKMLVDHYPPEWGYAFASDVLIGIMMATPPAKCRAYGVFSPSLAQHVGARSLVAPGATVVGWGRNASNFQGEDFDCLSIDFDKVQRHLALLPRQMRTEDKMRLRFRDMGPSKDGIQKTT